MTLIFTLSKHFAFQFVQVFPRVFLTIFGTISDYFAAGTSFQVSFLQETFVTHCWYDTVTGNQHIWILDSNNDVPGLKILCGKESVASIVGNESGFGFVDFNSHWIGRCDLCVFGEHAREIRYRHC